MPLDRMINLGLTDRDTASRVLIEDVGLSKAMARQEVDRYTVRSPASARAVRAGALKRSR